MMKRIKNFIWVLLILIICTALITPLAQASGDINVFLPAVSVTLTGEKQEVPEAFEIILKAEDPSYPMPEGSVGGVYKATVTGGDMLNLPDILFTSPGTYRYTITQTPGTNELGNYDDSVFHITINIFTLEDGSGLESRMTIRKNEELEELDYIDFVNDYEVIITEEETLNGLIEIPDDEEVMSGEIELPEETIPRGEAGGPANRKSNGTAIGEGILFWYYIAAFIGAGILLFVIGLTVKKKVKG